MIVPQEATRLCGHDMEEAQSSLKNAWLRVEDGKIHSFGSMSELTGDMLAGQDTVDARGGLLLPAFCDSHTHII